nr:carbohydrate kinase [uncultured Butyricicoccus sp.]
MFDVTALGEVLIDFTAYGENPQTGMALFERNPGGAPANVVAAVSRLGGKTAFIGKVGQDMHGAFLKETLEQIGIDTRGLCVDASAFTTLAFVSLDSTGERVFSFARKPGADTCLRAEDVPEELLSDSRILHFGSLSMTDEPACSATRYAVEQEKKQGAIISYDPNDRPLLWDSRERAQNVMRSVLPLVDVLKISDEETLLMSGEADPEAASKRLLEQGIGCVVVTLGAKGALVRTAAEPDKVQIVPGFRSQVADTTGAGDSFWGGFLYQIAQSGKHPSQLTSEEAAEFVRFGNAVASLCVEKRGAIPAMPTMEQVQARLEGKA